MINEGERGPPGAAMAAAIGARGELGSGRESEGRQLGLVEEGTEVLTSRGIGLRWAGKRDRRWRCYHHKLTGLITGLRASWA